MFLCPYFISENTLNNIFVILFTVKPVNCYWCTTLFIGVGLLILEIFKIFFFDLVYLLNDNGLSLNKTLRYCNNS